MRMNLTVAALAAAASLVAAPVVAYAQDVPDPAVSQPPSPAATAAPASPTASPTATAPAPGGSKVGQRSGLPFDSGVFAHDAVVEAGKLGRVGEYERITGRPVDVWGIAPLRDQGDAGLVAETERIAGLIPDWVQVDWAVPLVSKAVGADLGRAMCKATPDPYVRPGWEFNLTAGNWDWNTEKIGNDGYIAGYRATIDGIRSTCPGVRAEWNPNSGQGGPARAELAWPGDDYVDVVGVDTYDWNYENPITMPGGLDEWAQWTRAKGKKMSLPEWGAHGGDTGRGDNPAFIRDVMAWAEKNSDVVVMLSYFDENADYIRNSVTQMPQVGAELKAQFDRLASAPATTAPAATATAEPESAAPTETGSSTVGGDATETEPAAAPAAGDVPAAAVPASGTPAAATLFLLLWNPAADTAQQFRVFIDSDGKVEIREVQSGAAPVAPAPAVPSPAAADVPPPSGDVTSPAGGETAAPAPAGDTDNEGDEGDRSVGDDGVRSGGGQENQDGPSDAATDGAL